MADVYGVIFTAGGDLDELATTERRRAIVKAVAAA